MKKLTLLFSLFLFSLSCFLNPVSISAQEATDSTSQAGFVEHLSGAIAVQITGAKDEGGDQFKELSADAPMNMGAYLAGRLNKKGQKSGLLPISGSVIAELYQQQPSSREYIADLLDSVGVPTVTSAYAQGTGYKAMSPFLVFWKAFRNLAYSLYIIMFVVVGIMIMLRTKVSAQAVITIQAALPNLLITLLLITFSYAIVGFMIDLMYFLIYFIVYLIDTIGIINSPTKVIDRLLSYSAWGVLFEGRNSIVSAISLAIGDVLSGLGTGALEVAGTLLSWVTFPYLIVAIAFAIAMLKLMAFLLKAYVMLIVQTVTAPIQILMNALPGSKAFGEWLKKTASYLIPFPVAAVMFIFAAILVGDPTKSTIFHNDNTTNANPFDINTNHEFYTGYGGLYNDGTGKIWMPPFTLTGNIDFNAQDVLTIIGFVVFLMTPAAVKMAQDWLQVKESPYTAEAFSNLGMGLKGGTMPASWGWKTFQEEQAAKRSAKALGQVIGRPKDLHEKGDASHA